MKSNQCTSLTVCPGDQVSNHCTSQTVCHGDRAAVAMEKHGPKEHKETMSPMRNGRIGVTVLTGHGGHRTHGRNQQVEIRGMDLRTQATRTGLQTTDPIGINPTDLVGMNRWLARIHGQATRVDHIMDIAEVIVNVEVNTRIRALQAIKHQWKTPSHVHRLQYLRRCPGMRMGAICLPERYQVGIPPLLEEVDRRNRNLHRAMARFQAVILPSSMLVLVNLGRSTGEVSPFGWHQKAGHCPRRCKDPD